MMNVLPLPLSHSLLSQSWIRRPDRSKQWSAAVEKKASSLGLNRAYQGSKRQPGSTFKILAAYAPALDSCDKTLSQQLMMNHILKEWKCFAECQQTVRRYNNAQKWYQKNPSTKLP